MMDLFKEVSFKDSLAVHEHHHSRPWQHSTMQKPGLIIGQKGVKYGLHVRNIKQEDQKKTPAGRLAAFSADSDSDEDVGAQVARQAARKVADTKVQEMYAAALAEDPSAFDYDGVYDSLQEQKAAPKLQDKIARQPKYIASLLEQAQLRKKEQEITHERMLLKERQKEDHMYDNEEKFITSAYRKKLEEDKKWQESQRLKELEEQRNDVTKLGHMNNFFHNLTKNVALGGAAKQPQRSKQQEPAAVQEAATAAAAGDTDEAVARAMAEAEAGMSRQEQQHSWQRSASPGSETVVDGKQHPQQAGKEQQRRHLESSAVESARQQQLGQAAAAAVPGKRHAAAADHKDSSTERQHERIEQQGQVQAAAPQTATAGGKRKNDDSAVAAARERYLARKLQQQQRG